MVDTFREPLISVGILTNTKVTFELYGDFKTNVSTKNTNGIFTAEIINGEIVCNSVKVKLTSKDELIFEPNDLKTDTFLIRDVTIGVKFHWERKQKQRFSGLLKLKKDKDEIAVINILPIENYLSSVISSEMSAKSSLQLLKAHAIVSRSWLLAQIEKSRSLKKAKAKYSSSFESDDEHIKWYDREDHELFDVCADDHCQRYQGVTKIFTEIARDAVTQTHGIVLVSGEKICDARYSKSCGGISESFENVWEPIKYDYLISINDYKFPPENFNTDFLNERNSLKWIKGNPASYCNTTDKKILSQVLLDFDQETTDFFRWRVIYTQAELSEIIKAKSGIDFGNIIDLVPTERGKSSRLIKLKIVGTNKTMVVGKELEIRKFLSKSHLYSSAIVIEKSDIQNGVPQKFEIFGAGWGHGVGLCQIGAAVMAEKGHEFDEILLHYFKNAELKKIY
ncbi:MAG: amidase [Ignavibacteria bacterium RIFOXYB2_FULL_35_12]|nr:MAG: amidase [Ignavibacteria bacterium GWA2_36_19]OGU55661.1 MAG: amidase [Ignavibacteria bacterium GWC2_35_8]OGU57680.1 MAG: amidase [Ignavibacteria bacterium GWF2_35_20]OGU79394.1 MAG: amidase [Ignavibacteria bacterium RIFOXYA2_FULL_35_9]OGU89621.1 MAG: amidase [Ignavibacteria bacterium RIFOXYA12_FULL_35_25]OGU94683.1 MAG: amidase [Ignavibacteria bacterium RIFOXYB12_FULL_35_14]OGV01670.1 MAG: amidase [Ignavibacteria bacterium RIFOXYC2_FULL_35_16]OGV03967.1 MAG: amidase [Ignavibacteria b